MYQPLIVKGEADPESKRCYDCRFCQGAVSWWCTNEEAIKARGTRIPGVRNCPFWEAADHKRDVSWFKRFTTSYIEIKCD